MQIERGLTIVLTLALAFSLGIQFSHAEVRPAELRDLSAPAAPVSVSSGMTIQGRLTDAAGNPLNGSYNVTFRIYDVSSGGTALCTTNAPTLSVNNGLFSHTVYCPAAVDGRSLCVGITVGSDAEMSPRMVIYPVAYALSLRPGAVISDSVSGGPLLHLENWSSTGRGLRAYAMADAGINYAVGGASRSPQGYGGYFYNEGGGSAVFARSLDDGSDLVLGGNGDGDTADDGILSSDPAYAASDLILRSNHDLRVELDHDGAGATADLTVVRHGATIFNVDQSGNVSYSGALVGAFPRPAYDSDWTNIAQSTTLTLNHNLYGTVDDYVVDLTCKGGTGHGVNTSALGGMTAYAWDTLTWYGVYWKELTTTSIKVMRYDDDDGCPQIRVRIWATD